MAIENRTPPFASLPFTKLRYTAAIERQIKEKIIPDMAELEHPRVPIILGVNVDMDLGTHRLSDTSDFKQLRDQAEYVVPVTTITPYESCAKFETTDFGKAFLKSQKQWTLIC